MSLVIHPTYFPNVLFFSKILNHNKILFEINDNYIKNKDIPKYFFRDSVKGLIEYFENELIK